MLVGAHKIGAAGGCIEALAEEAVRVGEVAADDERAKVKGQGSACPVRDVEERRFTAESFEEPGRPAFAVAERRIRHGRA